MNKIYFLNDFESEENLFLNNFKSEQKKVGEQKIIFEHI